MGRSIRILHLADSHIGSQLPARPRNSHAWRRGDDIVRSYQTVLRHAIDLNVDLVLHAGDVFDEPAPSEAAITAASAPLLALAAAGILVVVIPGNHERSILPGSLFLSHPNVHVMGQPVTKQFAFDGVRINVVGVPCIRRHSAVRFSAALDETGWREQPRDVNILLTHQAFESSVCGPANYRFRKGGDDVVARDCIPSSFSYVAAGHIHRHQVLTGGPTAANDDERTASLPFEGDADAAVPIVYSGSVDRISFAEQDEPKGCVLIEIEDGTLRHRFLEHAVRPMTRLPLDVSGLSKAAIRDSVVKWALGLPTGALAQVRLSGRTSPPEMRGLALAAEVAAARPDLLFSTSAQAVVFEPRRSIDSKPESSRIADDSQAIPSRESLPGSGLASTDSPFDVLRGDRVALVACAADDVKSLPTTFGTYALFDAADRLLYVGKASNLRTRIRQHLAARPSGAFFEGWTRNIARIVARVAHGELEALLVEAELIRVFQPPFNRQMRQWDRYCYLVEGTRPFGELAIVRDIPQSSNGDAPAYSRLFGPYRSRYEAAAIAEAVARHFSLAYCRDLAAPPGRARQESRQFATAQSAVALVGNLCQRYFDGACAGPCAARAEPMTYEEQIRARAALLDGRDDSPFAEAERKLEEIAERPEDLSDDVKAAIRHVQTLRQAFEAGWIISDARRLVGTTIALPGDSAESVLVTLATDRLCITRGPKLESQPSLPPENANPIPKSRLDSLATVVRYRKRVGDLDAQTTRAPLNNLGISVGLCSGESAL